MVNVEMPEDLERAVVYATPSGPALAKPDPKPWSNEHAKQADEHASKLKEQIDERGYYAKTLDVYAGRLADETGYNRNAGRGCLQTDRTLLLV